MFTGSPAKDVGLAEPYKHNYLQCFNPELNLYNPRLITFFFLSLMLLLIFV